MVKLAGGVIALIVAIGGALFTLDSNYARKTWADAQFAQYDQRLAAMRLNDVDAQISRLENDKRFRKLTQFELNLLSRLYTERRILCAQLRIPNC